MALPVQLPTSESLELLWSRVSHEDPGSRFVRDTLLDVIAAAQAESPSRKPRAR